jgi:transcriptional regulator with XRE-family HTH domain
MKKTVTFGDRFDLLVREFGSRYRLSKASGISESTLQQYARSRSDLPPRADILMKLARAANVSVEWLASGQGEMRPAGLLPGAAYASAIWVEVRGVHAALSAEEIKDFFPFSRNWLELRLGVTDGERLMALEAEEDLPPSIKGGDLLLVDRRVEKKVPGRDGIYILSVARGLAVRRIHARIDRQFLISRPGISEQVTPSDLSRHIVGEVVWRGGRV